MATPEGCPCDCVENIEKRLDALEKKEAGTSTSIVAMQKDIEYIKEKVTERSKFNGNIVSTIVQCAVAAIMGYIAIKIGIA